VKELSFTQYSFILQDHYFIWPPTFVTSSLLAYRRLRLKRDGTRAETRFRPSAKRTNPFKSAGASIQSTTGSRGVRISCSNGGYTKFRVSVKSTGYPLHSSLSPSLPLPCVTVCHHISTGLYNPQPLSGPPTRALEFWQEVVTNGADTSNTTFFFSRHCNPCGFWPDQLSLSILSRKVFTQCRCQRHVKPPNLEDQWLERSNSRHQVYPTSDIKH